MGQHRVEQRVVPDDRVVQAELGVDAFLAAHRVAYAQAGAGDHLREFVAAGRRGEIVDHARLDAGLADQRQGSARAAAARIVEDRDVHGSKSGNGKASIVATALQRFRTSWRRFERFFLVRRFCRR
jgi:hypothetical protein